MKIVVFEIEDWERASFERLRASHEVSFVHEPLTEDNAAQYAGADIVSVFIYSELTKKALTAFKNLKMIATRSTGFDHVDMKAASAGNIAVCNVPTYGEATVAEHVFALLFTISHHMFDAIDRTRRGDFSQEGLQGFDLAGKTIGVIGTGNIGLHVIAIARGLGMKILAHDIAPNVAKAEELGFTYLPLDDLLKVADIITLHVPGSDKTKDMLSARELSLMKNGAVLINTARGSVVNVEALVEALATGKLRAAGLDVLPDEPVIKEEAELLRTILHEKYDLKTLLLDHVLLRMRNVFITPHSAFNTKEAILRILSTTVENIEAFAAGKTINRV